MDHGDALRYRIFISAREQCAASPALLDAIRSYVVRDEPPLEDLVARWDDASTDFERMCVTLRYEIHAFRRRWAWDGLSELLATVKERREPVPDCVKDWACDVALRLHKGTLKIPRRAPNRHFAPKDERDLRIQSVYVALHDARWSRKQCEEVIMSALDPLDAETVRSIFRKMELRLLYAADSR